MSSDFIPQYRLVVHSVRWYALLALVVEVADVLSLLDSAVILIQNGVFGPKVQALVSLILYLFVHVIGAELGIT